MTTIKINDYITLNQGITSEEGFPVYEKIASALANGDEVTLDFADVTFLTTAFLNAAIGTLYKDYSSERLQESLHIQNISQETAARIKKVTTNAKEFYSDSEKFNKTVEEVMYGSVSHIYTFCRLSYPVTYLQIENAYLSIFLRQFTHIAEAILRS